MFSFLLYSFVFLVLLFLLFLLRHRIRHAFRRLSSTAESEQMSLRPYLYAFAIILIGVIALFRSIEIVPAGHVHVASLFGDVETPAYEPGFHLVNPLLAFTSFDTRQKTYFETISVPSQDQLLTSFDVSVQYRISDANTPHTLQNTGTPGAVLNIHIIPTLRSVFREQGRQVDRAEDFFLETIQQQMQDSSLEILHEKLLPKGAEIQGVLIRDVRLPDFIQNAIEAKKEADQLAAKAIAELRRYETEQQQQIVRANADRQAAVLQAEQRRTLADASAYEITAINEAIADSPGYLQLQQIRALESIANDPAAKIYFIDPEQGTLPLIHFNN